MISTKRRSPWRKENEIETKIELKRKIEIDIERKENYKSKYK